MKAEKFSTAVTNNRPHNNNLELPLVSVIIVNYNYGSFLPVAIESCLSQSYSNVEVIVVDDGSKDNSADIILGFGNQITHIFKENGGQASALNAGFSASNGQIICLLDADDLFLTEKTLQVANAFTEYPNIGWVFTESAPVETSEILPQKISDLFSSIRSKHTEKMLNKIDFRENLKNGQSPSFTPSTSNLCFSREVLEEIFPLPEIKGISGMAITDLYIKTLAVGLSVGCVTYENLGIYRLHNNYYTTLDINKKRRMFGEIHTTTGYWIQHNFPEFKKISDKILSKGIATYFASSYSKNECKDADCNSMFREYLQRSSIYNRLLILLKVACYRTLLIIKDFV